MKTKKVYNFNMPRVKNRLVKLFKERKNEASISDLVTESGLPSLQVQEGVKVVLKEYRGHMKVTESGELLYYFPQGMHNQEKGPIPALKKALNTFLRGLGKFFTLLFKVWIMVMLVGYFVLFLAVLVGALALSIAASFAGNKESSRDRSGGGFYLVIRVIELFMRIWFYNSLLDDGYSRRRSFSTRRSRGPRRPLHKSVFDYVFGPEDPNKEWEQKETRYLLSFIRAHKGIITQEEVMAITGKSEEDAQQIINNLLIRFEGEPEVTEEGTIIYSFPQLLKTADTKALTGFISLTGMEKKKEKVFSGNPAKTDKWITFFNGFNLLFSGYFFFHAVNTPVVSGNLKLILHQVDFSILYKLTHYMVAQLTSGDPAGIILIILGVIPFLFSLLFYLTAFIRSRKNALDNRKIKENNLSKSIYSRILANPGNVIPREMEMELSLEKLPDSPGYITKVVEHFAARKSAEIAKNGLGTYIYNFKELDREVKDVEEHRKKINLNNYALGETVFDSGE